MAEYAAMGALRLYRPSSLQVDPYSAYESSLLVLHTLDSWLALKPLEEPLLFAHN